MSIAICPETWIQTASPVSTRTAWEYVPIGAATVSGFERVARMLSSSVSELGGERTR